MIIYITVNCTYDWLSLYITNMCNLYKALNLLHIFCSPGGPGAEPAAAHLLVAFTASCCQVIWSLCMAWVTSGILLLIWPCRYTICSWTWRRRPASVRTLLGCTSPAMALAQIARTRKCHRKSHLRYGQCVFRHIRSSSRLWPFISYKY